MRGRRWKLGLAALVSLSKPDESGYYEQGARQIGEKCLVLSSF